MTIVTSNIDLAAQFLRDGKLVAFATETVYGLGADATNDLAVARIFDVKERPQFNPLIVHVASNEAAMALGRFDSHATRLAEGFWPGPLTLVVPRTAACSASQLVSAGLDSIALRVPQHPMARELLVAVQRPVAAPSANLSGRISPTRPEHVVAALGDRIEMVLDGGECLVGVESTIISCLDASPVLLRPGGVTRESIETELGQTLDTSCQVGAAPVAPGQLAAHYAPRAAVRLNARDARAGEALLAFGSPVPGQAETMRNLSESGDLVEAAANLFKFLHELDAAGVDGIAVMPIPDTGLGVAINDRLQRASVRISDQ